MIVTGTVLIITSVYQVILNVIEFGMNVGDAVNAHRFHHQWLPDAIQYEKGTFTEEQIKALEALGHQTKERSSIGRVEAIVKHPNGQLEGAADRRGDDHAEAW